MKKMNLAKCVVVLVITFVASLSTYAAKMNNNLIYNAQEVNGLKVAETVYKKDGNMLTNYMKYNYKYNDNNQMTENMSQKWNVNKNCWENDLCIRYTYDNKSVTTEYYKWNSKKNDFILIPEMTVTMELEDGESVTCAIITILTVNEKDYIILLPLDEKGENEDGEVWIYGYKEDESDPNAEPELFFIEDEDEYDAVSDAFDEYLDQVEFDELIDESSKGSR